MYDDVLGVRVAIDRICVNDIASGFKLAIELRVKSC